MFKGSYFEAVISSKFTKASWLLVLVFSNQRGKKKEKEKKRYLTTNHFLAN